MTYEELLEKARETYESEDTPYIVKAWLLANIIEPVNKSEDERIRKGLIKAFGTIGKKDWGGLIVGDILTWLERQGEKNTLNADDVIEWLDRNASMFWKSPCNPKNIIKRFKKDFGL